MLNHCAYLVIQAILCFNTPINTGEALQRVALGLSRNPSVTAPELLLYLHATLKPFVVTAIRDKEAQKRAKGRLIITAEALFINTHCILSLILFSFLYYCIFLYIFSLSRVL